MCLVFFSLGRHSNYPFILAYNRDEHPERPAIPATRFQCNGCTVVAGLDEPTQGTWLGISELGRIGFLTDVSVGPAPRGHRSRAQLLLDYLSQPSVSSSEVLTHIHEFGDEYKPFNLVLGTSTKLVWCSNVFGPSQELNSGVFGLGNAALNTPWPKLVYGRHRFATLTESERVDLAALFDLMSCEQSYTAMDVPETDRGCLGSDWEDYLDPIFLYNRCYNTSDYKGIWFTRSTTLLTINTNGEAQFIERTWEGRDYSERTLELGFSF